jgi:hypothetical protein
LRRRPGRSGRIAVSNVKKIRSVRRRKVAEVGQRTPGRPAIPAPDLGPGWRIFGAVERNAHRITIDADNPEIRLSARQRVRQHHQSWFIAGNAKLVGPVLTLELPIPVGEQPIGLKGADNRASELT